MAPANKLIFYSIFMAALLCCSCEENTQAWTLIQGSVLNIEDQKEVYPSFLFLGEKLLLSTGEKGTFEIDSLEPGLYSFLCSSMGFSDTLIQIEVKEGAITELDFFLRADDSKGRVYGELHDQSLYNEQLNENPSMSGWNEEELFDGVSGATIQTMTFGYDLPAAEIYIGDSLLTLTDGFGQYWTDIQSGTYPIRVSMPGWEDQIHVVNVEAGYRAFCNFILPQQTIP